MTPEIDLKTFRHSTSHVMAQAVQELFPGVKLGIGPAIENGFYYDFDLPVQLIPADPPKIEKKMQEIIHTNQKFTRIEMTNEEAIKLFFQGKINFAQLPARIKMVLYRHENKENPSLEDILAADQWARELLARKD